MGVDVTKDALPSANVDTKNVFAPTGVNVEWLTDHLDGLVIFRDILQDKAVRELQGALYACRRHNWNRCLSKLSAFEAALFTREDDWSRYLSRLILESDNFYIRQSARGTFRPVLSAALEKDFAVLQCLSRVRLEDFDDFFDEFHRASDCLAGWNVSDIELLSEYRKRMEQVSVTGYGIFARYAVFTVQNRALVPVKHPDPQTLDELPGYEAERKKILDNTEALLNGQPAGNVLLYGDAGTGKSSTVKAIANQYAPKGLRLVEIKKNQLYELPEVMDTLAENPLKFILFIDDLSFTANDDNFSALKAILEGSAGGRAANTAVYATSNRRHLIKETLTDREGDDIHAADTRQELMSLAARFGLTVTFQVPDRERYLYIVRKLAQSHGVSMTEQELSVRAEAFAIRAGGRSARVAKQFVELCKAGVLHS